MLSKHIVLLGAVSVVLLAGCGTAADESNAAATATQSSAAVENPYGAASIDPPEADEAVLVVDGKSSDAKFTLDEFKALGATEITIFEPFVKQTQTFVGVPFDVVAEQVNMDPSSDLLTVALNDYRWTGNVGQLIDSQALIAYQVDGRDIGYDEGGPVRLIFPEGTPLSTELDAWNWSLAELAEQ